MHQPHRRRLRSFSITELVAAIVVIGLLAGVSYVAYGRVVQGSEDRAAQLTLASVGREAVPLALSRGSSVLALEDFQTAIGDLPDDGWRADVSHFGYSDTVRTIHVAVGGTPIGTSAGQALLTPRGACAFALTEGLSGVSETWVVDGDLGANCSGRTALGGPGSDPDYGDPAAAGSPSGVRDLRAAPGDTTLEVTWQPPADGAPPSAYRVFVDGAPHAEVPGSTLSLLIEGLTNGIAYVVEVQPINEFGDGPPRATSGTPMPPMPQLQSVSASAGDASATVTWVPADGSSPATGYTVWRNTTNDWATALPVFTLDTSHHFDGLANGTDYWFWVQATNLGGTSAPVAAEPSPVRPMPPLPAAPELTLRSPDDSTLVVAWQPVAGAAGYTLYYSATADPAFNPLTTTLIPYFFDGSFDVEIGGLDHGTRYWVWVVATNLSGLSPAASGDAPTRPAPPTELDVRANSGFSTTLSVRWQASPSPVVVGYRLSRAGTPAEIYEGTATEFGDSGLTGGTEYTYTAVAYNESGPSVPSAPGSGFTPPPPPRITSFATGSPDGTSYQGAFDEPPTAVLYRVQVRNNSSVTVMDVTQAVRTFAAQPGVRSQRYQARVVAENGEGKTGEWSEWTEWTAWTRPSDITSLAVTSGGLFGVQAALSYTNPAGTERNDVGRHVARVHDWELADQPVLGAGAINYVDPTAPANRGGWPAGLQPSVGWRGFETTYRVRACNPNGCGGYSPNARWDVDWPAPGVAERGVSRGGHSWAYGNSGPGSWVRSWYNDSLNSWNGDIPAFFDAPAQNHPNGTVFAHNWGSSAVINDDGGTGRADDVLQNFRYVVSFPRYGCYAFSMFSNDGHFLAIGDTRWGGSNYSGEYGFTGRLLWNTEHSGAGTYLNSTTTQNPNCRWVAPGERIGFHARHREVDGTAFFANLWHFDLDGPAGPLGFLAGPIPKERLVFGFPL